MECAHNEFKLTYININVNLVYVKLVFDHINEKK